jgi:hypothetical protein
MNNKGKTEVASASKVGKLQILYIPVNALGHKVPK